jgi:autotransporter-associated beta strand protein
MFVPFRLVFMSLFTPSTPSTRRPLSASLARCTSAVAICAALLAAAVPDASAANLLWDADGNGLNGVGGTGFWNTSDLRWIDTGYTTWPSLLSAASTSTAVFQGAPGKVSLGEPITANGLLFSVNGYTVDNGGTAANTLTLAGAGAALTVTRASDSATLSAVVAGSGGWTKLGRGALYLTNSGNTYTGATTINSGNVVVSSSGALGLDTSAVVVNGSSTRAAGGGALVLEGEASAFTFSRSLSLAGGGLNNDAAALVSTGNVLLTGPVATTSTGAAITRISSGFGTLTLGDVAVGGTARSTFTTFTGFGNAAITGVLSGNGTLEKAGPIAGVQGGTLILNPSSAANFSGTIRMTSGSVRIASPSAVGTSQATDFFAALDLRGGMLELRTDAVANNQVVFHNSMYDNAGGTVFLDHGVGSLGINTKVVLDTFFYDTTSDVTFNGRNGYGITFNAVTPQGSTANNSVLTFNQNGLATILGDYNGVLNFAGNSEALITGNLVTSSATTLIKSGTGTLTVQGSASTFGGIIAVNGSGTLAVNYLGALNNTAGTVLQLATGSTTVSGSGALNFLGAPGTGAGGTLVKTINMAGAFSGNNASILANQAGTAPTPLIVAGPFTSGAMSKTLTLGGSNTLNNEVSGVIIDNSGINKTSVLKTGDGTWVLSGANSYSGATGISGGALKVQANGAGSNVINDASSLNFVTNATTQTAGGIFEFIGQPDASNLEAVGVLNTLGGASTIKVTPGLNGTAALVFASINPVLNATTTAASAASTTVTVPTTGLTAGQGIYGAGVTPSSAISSITSGTALVASASQTIATNTPLTFTRATGATVNFAPAAGGSVIVQTLPAAGLVGGYAYFGGADFAYAPSATDATLRAPIYGTDPGFVVPGATLTTEAGNNVVMRAPAVTDSVALQSLKIEGSQTLNINASQLLTINTGTATSGGILVSGGSAIISGGAGSGITTAGQGDIVIRVNGATDELTLSTPITATSTGGLTKTGAGTLIVNALNAQTGLTQIVEGTVKLSGTAATTRLSAVTQGLVIRQAGTFDLNGISMVTGVLTSLNGSGTITNNGSSAATFFIGASGGAGTLTGVLQDGPTGTLAVSKTSTGTLNLNGLNTYTGVTSVNSTGGIATPFLADIGQASGIGKGVATDDASNAASLVFGAATSGFISYTGTSSISINRLFTLAATSAGLAGQIANNSPNNSALILNNTGAVRFNSTFAQTLLLGGTSTGDSQLFPKLTNNGALATGLNKTSTGVWVIANQNNDYTGATTIGTGGTTGAGTLRFIGTALPTTSPVVFSAPTTATGGVLEMSGSFTRTLAASAVAGASTVTWAAGTSLGGGFAASDSKLTVAIGGLATPTPLTWGSGGFMTSTGNLILSSPTALSEVEFTNAVNLGGSVRPIDIGDNLNTYTDYATISGVLSGAGGGLSKSGTGMLHLTGLSSYTGTTTVAAGALVVSSLGDSSVAGSLSNVGAASNALTSAVLLGNASTTGGTLIYVGHGETSDRAIQLNTTTGSTLLYADGSGPLVLRNVQNSAAVTGTKILALRGGSTFANEITSNLSNDGTGGVLSILHDAPGTWILSGNNNFSGTVTNSLGSLGLGSDTGFGTATLALSSVGTYFAANGDRTLGNAVTLSGGGSAIFVGDNSLTLTGAFSDSSSTTSATITNNIAAGKSLFLNGVMTRTAVSNTSSLQLAGTGSTVINGTVVQTTGGTYGITVQGPGTVTVNTAQNYNGGTNVGSGTLKYGIAQATPTTGTMTVGNQAGGNAVLDLNGFDSTLAALTFYGANASSTSQAAVRTGAGTLTLGGTLTYTATNNPLGAHVDGNVALSASRTFAINDSTNAPVDLEVGAVISGPAFGITKTGLGTLRLSAANTYTGATTINNGVVQYGANDAINAASAVTINATGAGLTATLDLNNFSGTVASLSFGGTSSTSTSTTNVQTGSGTLTLGGNVSYSNTGSPLGSTISGKLDLGAATRTFTINDSTTAAVDLTVDANVTAASGVGLIKAGTGTLTFTKGLNFGATSVFQNTAGTTNFGGVSDSFGSDFLVSGGTVNLTAATNVVSGNFQVGYGGTGNLNFTTAGGTLTVGSGSATNVELGVSTSGGAGGTINLTGSQQFTANVGTFRVGSLANASAVSLSAPVVVTLATNNDITASTAFVLADNGGAAGAVAQAASLQFGSGTNHVVTPSFTVGGRKGSPPTGAGAVVTIAPGGTLTLDNGAGTTDLFIGNSSTATATISLSTMDVSDGAFIATLGNVTIASKLGIGTTVSSSTGTLKIGASAQNAITANSVTVSNDTGGTATVPNAATGTLSFGGGTFTVANNVSLALHSGTGTSDGTLILTGGLFTIGGNITTSTVAGATAILTLDGGTLDMTAGNINVDTFNARSGTLKNVAQLQTGDGATAAALNKTTAGTLNLDGTNLYTGLTGIAEGTVVVSGSIAASSGVDIAAGASFIMDGTSTNRVKDTGTINVAGGTVAFTSAAAAQNGLSETAGTLALTASSTLDFGTHAANTLTLTGAASVDTFTLSIYNWSGSAYAAGATTDSGDPLQDRLLFSNIAGTGVSASQLSQISFFSDDGHNFLGSGMEIAGPSTGILEIVPVAIPEPSSIALLASAALLGLRRRRRA